jgi:hypothetical protein
VQDSREHDTSRSRTHECRSSFAPYVIFPRQLRRLLRTPPPPHPTSLGLHVLRVEAPFDGTHRPRRVLGAATTPLPVPPNSRTVAAAALVKAPYVHSQHPCHNCSRGRRHRPHRPHLVCGSSCGASITACSWTRMTLPIFTSASFKNSAALPSKSLSLSLSLPLNCYLSNSIPLCVRLAHIRSRIHSRSHAYAYSPSASIHIAILLPRSCARAL